MNLDVNARGSMTTTPASDEAVVGYGYASGGMTVDVEGVPASYTSTITITFDAPFPEGTEGACARVDGVERQCDIRSSAVFVDAGVLPPGTYQFSANLTAEGGFYANPLPEYEGAFDFPPELNATLEMTVTVSQ